MIIPYTKWASKCILRRKPALVGGDSDLVYSLFTVVPIGCVFVCFGSLFCGPVLGFPSSVAIIFLGE